MAVRTAQPDKHFLEAVRRLTAEFHGVLPKKVVADTVLGARRDLEGQIVPEALDEMLHRLAHHRLDTLRTRA